MSQNIEDIKKENEELKARLNLLSALNPSLYSGAASDSDEIDLRELWNAIWKGKWIIIVVTSIFTLGSVLYALSLSNEYKSTAILAPASQGGGAGGLAKLAGQFGGLASLAGINLSGASGEDKTVIAMELIKTWGFIEKFIEDNGIQAEVFGAKGWNRTTNELIYDTDIYDPVNKKWVREFDPAKGEIAVPSSWELYEEFKERISVNQDKTSGLVNLSVEYYSPVLAKEWADKLVKAINAHIQAQDKLESEKSIAYLNAKINETNVTGMQTVFYQLIEEQTKTLMLAEVSEEYVFKTLSEAKVAEEKSKPKRALVVVLAIMLGSLLSFMLVLVKYFSDKK